MTERHSKLKAENEKPDALGSAGSRFLFPVLPDSGFSLVEITIALGIAAFCLMAVVGLLPVGLNNNRSSIEKTVAANLARSIVADLRAAKYTTNTNLSPQYSILFSTTNAQTTYFNDDGTKVSSAPSGGLRATTTLNTNLIPASVYIRITWPAALVATSTPDSLEITTTIDR